MKKLMILIPSLALLMLLTVAPVLASKPGLTYTYAIFGEDDPANPGTEFTTADNIVHGHKVGSIASIYGLPWGTGVGSAIGNWELNLTKFTGGGLSHILDTFDAGTIEGVITMKFTGLGMYTYHGPTFTVYGVTITDGMMFGGLLFEGKSLKYGTSGELDGLKIHGSYTGVEIFVGPPALYDKLLMVETSTFTG